MAACQVRTLECHRVTSEVGSLVVHYTGQSILCLLWSSSESPVFSGVTLTLLSPCSKHLSSNTNSETPAPTSDLPSSAIKLENKTPKLPSLAFPLSLALFPRAADGWRTICFAHLRGFALRIFPTSQGAEGWERRGGRRAALPARQAGSLWQQLCLAFTLPPRGKSFLSLQASPLPHQRQDKEAAEGSLHCQHPTPALTCSRQTMRTSSLLLQRLHP